MHVCVCACTYAHLMFLFEGARVCVSLSCSMVAHITLTSFVLVNAFVGACICYLCM